MPIFRVPPPFRGPTHGAEEVEVTGANLRACIDAAEALHPGFAALLIAATGEPHRFVRFALNGTVLQGPVLDRTVAPDDVLDILSSIAGG
jgi:hypothetical protein